MIKRLNIQIHSGSKLSLVCVEDSKEIESFASSSNIEIPDNKYGIDGLFCKQGSKFFIIFHKDTSHGDLAHEVIHFINALYDAIGQELDIKNDEAYAHSISYFTNECIKFQNKYNDRKN